MTTRHLMLDRPREPSQDVYRVYSFNRFTACRYGMQAGFIDAYARSRRLLKEDIAETLDILVPHALALGSGAALAEIGTILESVRMTAAGCATRSSRPSRWATSCACRAGYGQESSDRGLHDEWGSTLSRRVCGSLLARVRCLYDSGLVNFGGVAMKHCKTTEDTSA